ncbi:MAG: hypothetical protein K6B71_03890 [Alphaproteobacteria bacterium]|nr:hypothetical protein [Alphaproteobacteria bacterium]
MEFFDLNLDNARNISNEAKMAGEQLLTSVKSAINASGGVYADGVYKLKNSDNYVVKQTYYLIPTWDFYFVHLVNNGTKTKKDVPYVDMDSNLRERLDIRCRAQIMFSFNDAASINSIIKWLNRYKKNVLNTRINKQI